MIKAILRYIGSRRLFLVCRKINLWLWVLKQKIFQKLDNKIHYKTLTLKELQKKKFNIPMELKLHLKSKIIKCKR